MFKMIPYSKTQVVVLLFQLMFVLFNSYIAFELSYKIAILYLTVLQFLYVVRVGIYNNKLRRECDCCFRIVWGLAMISYEGCLIYYLDHPSFPIHYLMIAVAAFTAFWMAFQCRFYQRNRSNKNFLTMAFVFVRFLIVCQILFINLKWSAWHDWNWTATFMIVWVMLGIIAIVQLVFLIDLLCKLSVLLQESDQESREAIAKIVIGSLWVNLILLCFSAVPSFTFICYSFRLEGKPNDLNQMAITLSVLYSLVFVVYTLYYRQILCAFILVFRDIGNDLRNRTGMMISYQHVNSPSNRKQYIFSDGPTSKKDVMNRLPAFLLRLSSTYFLPDESKSQPENKRHKTEMKPPSSQNQIEVKSNSITEIQLDKTSQCFNCYQDECSAVYMPCGHGGICIKCALGWFNEKHECLICRKSVQSVVRVEGDPSDANRVRVVDVVGFC